MTTDDLLYEHDFCRKVAAKFPRNQPFTLRNASKKTWHICYFSVESFTVVFTIYIGPRGGQKNRITVLDDSGQIPAVDRIACWSSRGTDSTMGIRKEKLLSFDTLSKSEVISEDAQILHHLRSRVELLLNTPKKTVTYIRELIDYFHTHPDASSISALEGGATGL